MRRMLIACALVVCWSPDVFSQPANPPSAAQPDAYADADVNDQIASYKYLREQVLDDVRAVYFAVGCQILPEEGAAPIVADEAAYLEQDAFSNHYLDVQWSDLRDDAAREGLATASAATCDYWPQHPEAVLAMLEAATAAMAQSP